MHILKTLLSLACSCLFMLSLQAAPASNAQDLRAKAEEIIKKQQQKESQKDYYKNLKSDSPVQPYVDAAKIYLDLLTNYDDENSNKDLLGLQKSCEKAYETYTSKNDLSEDQQDTPIDLYKTITATLEKHQSNARYLKEVWELSIHTDPDQNTFDYSPWLSKKIQEKFISTPTYHYHYEEKVATLYARLKLGDQILNLLPGNMTEDEHATFLLEYAQCYCHDVEFNQPAYGFFHLLTDFEQSSIFTQNGESLIRNKKDFQLLDANGAPRSYKTPTSWEAARNDGERVSFLLSKVRKDFPSYDTRARIVKATALVEAFSPVTSLDLILGDKLLYTEENKLEFCNHLPVLRDNDSLIFSSGKIHKLELPQDLAYLDELKSLAYALPLNASAKSEHHKAEQKKLENLQRCIIYLYIDELIHRLRYAEALTHAEALLASLKDASKDDFLMHYLPQTISQLKTDWVSFYSHDGEILFADNDITIPIVYRNAKTVEVQLYKLNTDKLSTHVKELSSTKKVSLKTFFTRFDSDLEEILSSNPLKNKDNKENESSLSAIDYHDQPTTLTFPLVPDPERRECLDYLQFPKLKSGIYRLELRTNPQNSPIIKYINVTGIKVNAFKSKEGLLVSVTENKGAKPRANAQISVLQLSQNTPNEENRKLKTPSPSIINIKEFTVQTDEKGTAAIPMEEGAEEHPLSYLFFLSTSSGEDVSYNYYQNPEQKQTNIVEKSHCSAALVTDRPVYRSGQTLYWTAWVGQSSLAGKASPMSGTKIEISYDGLKETEILTTDERGMLSGSFTIPKTAKLSRYDFKLSLAGDKTKEHLTHLDVYVEEYKKQEIKVTVASSKKTYEYGEQAKVTVTARYYSGEPVTQGQVKIRVDNRRPFENGTTEFIPEKIIPLNAQGEAVLEFNLPQTSSVSEDDTSPCYMEGEVYEVTTTTSDASLRQIEENIHFYVKEKPFDIFFATDLPYGKSGENMSGAIKFETANGDPISATGEAVLSLITVDPENKKKVLSWAITTNEQGQSKSNFIPPGPGKYELHITFPINQEKNRFVSSDFSFYILPKEGEETPEFSAPTNVKIIPLNTSIKPGQQARALIISPPSVQSVLMGRSMAYETEEVRSIPTPGLLTETVWNVEEKHAPGFNLTLLSPVQGGEEKNVSYFIKEDDHNVFLSSHLSSASGQSVPLQKEPDSQNSNKTSLPGAESVQKQDPLLQPGDSAKLQVFVKKKDNTPAANTPVIITVFDKALEDFYSGNFDDLRYNPFWLFSWNYYNPESRSDLRGIGLVKYNHSDWASLMSSYAVFAYIKDDAPSSCDASATLLPEQGSVRQELPKNKRQLVLLATPRMDNQDVAYASGAGHTDIFDEEENDWEQSPLDMTSTPFAPKAMNDLPVSQGKSSLPARVRKNFADLMKWSGTLITDENGMVELPLTMPDNLTSWRVLAGSVDKDLNTGYLSAEFKTTQFLIAQLHTPRFLVVKDKSQFTALLRNNTDKEEKVEVTLTTAGDTLQLLTDEHPATQKVTVPAKGSASVNWTALAIKEGAATLSLTAKGETLKDASSQTLPLIVRGAYKSESRSGGLLAKQKNAELAFSIPSQADHSLSRLDINLSPGVAPVVMRALPFLSEYPYGCIEQTLNKFLPSVIVRNTLQKMKVDLAPLEKDTPGVAKTPINTETLEKHIRVGLAKLHQSQNKDGGWGWFAGGKSSPYISAQVVHGLLVLNPQKDKADDEMAAKMLAQGLDYLDTYEQNRIAYLQNDKNKKEKADATDVYVHSVLVESAQASLYNKAMTDLLIRDRHEFTAFPLTQLGLITHRKGHKTVLQDIQKALGQLIKTDKEAQASWLALPPTRSWWNWDQDDIETQASYLKLLSTTLPHDTVTKGVAKWLANNRENGFYWKSTRDTALAVEALCTYMEASGEGMKPLTAHVLLDGRKVGSISYAPATLATFKGDLLIEAAQLPAGDHKVEIIRADGDLDTPIYYAAGLKYFSLEDKLTASGKDIVIKRSLARLTAEKGEDEQVKYKKTPLPENASLASGDLIEVALEIEAQNDYQYLMIRDPKPAGCEPFNLISGYNSHSTTERGFYHLSYYTELADKETRIFAESLPRGKNTITYKLRVERPGTYTALPTQIEAMYTPILRGNSNEAILTIQKQPDK